MATAAAAAGVTLQSKHHHHPDHARISSSRLLQAGSSLQESNGGGGGASGNRFSQKSKFGRFGLRRQARDAHSRQEVVCCAVQGSDGGGRDSCYAGRDTRMIFPQKPRFGKLGLRQAGNAHSRREVTCSALRGSNRGGKDSCDDGCAARRVFPRFEKLGLRPGGASHARQKTVRCASNAGEGEASDGGASFREKIEAFGEALSSGFPLWVAAACLAGMVRPAAFTWIQGQVQIIGLSITMLGMGMTMSLDDLKGALAMPRELVAGVVLQYTVMPAAGALISRFFSLPANYAAGLILVACCPGGTASNVVTYLARGNVALSVLMTAASTFMAVAMTPMLTSKLVGQYVAVDAGSLFFSTLQVVLLPVTVGVLMAHYLPGLVRRVSPLAPSVAVVTVAAICAGAISQSAATIRQSGGQVLAAVVSLHVAGFLFGYLLSRVLGFEESTSRTISIEVGMQNSVLGVVLASKHFGSPLVAVPCAVSSVCHSIIGSALARFWRSQAPSSDDAVLS